MVDSQGRAGAAAILTFAGPGRPSKRPVLSRRFFMDEREQNLNREEKTDGMPDVLMEIPADEFSADEFSADGFSADETPAEGFSADEIPAEDISADQIPVDVFPDEQKEENLTVSSESVTEILSPENKDISPEGQAESFGSDESDIYGGIQNGSKDTVRTASPDFSGVQENDGAADLVRPAPSDSFEQNTTYVRTEEPSEASKTLEHSPQTEEEPYRQAGMSEEQLNHQADRSVEEQYRQAGRPEGEQNRQEGRNGQETYRQDGGRNADWRSQASRTNDTNGSFDSAEGRNGGRYSSSYDRYRFENPSNRGPVNTPDPRFPEESKKPSSGKENKNGKRGWIAAGIAAGVLAAAFLLFFGIRAALMSAVNIARSTPPAEAQAGAQAGAEAEAPAKEPEITIGNPDQKPENPQAAGRADTETTEQREEMTVPEVVQMCLPSMVAITNTTVEEYRDYFGGTRTYENVSAGSGIIIGGTETELLIATNNHVIANSSDITVTFIDDSVCSGTVKGQASDEDLAIISVNLSDIPAETKEQIAIVAIGDSDELQVGETVVAIGNALGYGQSVSRGVVSALNRDVTVDGVTHTLIQTDASINPGNSGGALLNLRGELIGINEVKYVNTEVEGIGYAIPINVAEPILTNLGSRVQREKVGDEDRAYIGIKCVGVNSEYVQYGYPAGVYVSEVTPGGPADQAGLRTGDIITAIDGVPVSTTDQLLDNLEYYAAGETVDFSVSREGAQIGTFETTKIPITLGRRSESGLDDSSEGNGTAAPEDSSGNEERDARGFPTMPE